MVLDKINKRKLIFALEKSWSLESSSKWTKENPAKGQCSVTALVVNDIFRGEILKTLLKEGWHFYNKIDNEIYDFTKSQFESEIEYNDIVSSRSEAFLNTNMKQYTFLRSKINDCFARD